jgi:mannose-6-phosphate isomerase-like protein (cupin superfamily)
MHPFTRPLLLSLLALTITGCQSSSPFAKPRRVQVIMPHAIIGQIDWTSEEVSQESASRSLRVTRSASYHLLRVRTAQKPQVYDRNDIVMTILSGPMVLNLGVRRMEVNAGDVVDIPRGTVYWMENDGKKAGEAFVVFTPPQQEGEVRYIDIGGTAEERLRATVQPR